MTEHPTVEGKPYLCAIKDVFSGRIVGYCISNRLKSQLAVHALASAVTRRGGDVSECVVHSDRGSQFRSKRFGDALDQSVAIRETWNLLSESRPPSDSSRRPPC